MRLPPSRGEQRPAASLPPPREEVRPVASLPPPRGEDRPAASLPPSRGEERPAASLPPFIRGVGGIREGSKTTDGQLIAACGLDCGSCEIRLLPTDEKAAREAIDWYRQQGWLKEDEGLAEALARKMYCCGCHGDRSIHWSADCWILHCCVDERGLPHCSA